MAGGNSAWSTHFSRQLASSQRRHNQITMVRVFAPPVLRPRTPPVSTATAFIGATDIANPWSAAALAFNSAPPAAGLKKILKKEGK